MKVKRIGTICKARKTCILYNEDNADGEIVRQWISCGAAMWPVSGLPMLQEKHLSSLFQFEAKQAKEMRIYEDLIPDALREVTGDWEEWEADLQESSLIVAGEGMSLSMLSSGDKHLWINRDLLSPCWTGQTRIIRRESGLGPVAAVMDGMLISGIILPAQLPADFYRELLRMGCSRPYSPEYGAAPPAAPLEDSGETSFSKRNDMFRFEEEEPGESANMAAGRTCELFCPSSDEVTPPEEPPEEEDADEDGGDEGP